MNPIIINEIDKTLCDCRLKSFSYAWEDDMETSPIVVVKLESVTISYQLEFFSEEYVGYYPENRSKSLLNTKIPTFPDKQLYQLLGER